MKCVMLLGESPLVYSAQVVREVEQHRLDHIYPPKSNRLDFVVEVPARDAKHLKTLFLSSGRSTGETKNVAKNEKPRTLVRSI